MRIKAIYLDQYGIYRRHNILDLPKGLVVFVGNNESGKTTLMRFIRSVLFGFPKNGGADCSGKLLIEDQAGQEFLISRSGKSAVITGSSGQVVPLEPAVKWLNGLDRATYEKVFAIGLEDLQGLKLLSENTVRSRFFAGAGGTALVEAIKKVEEERADLLVAAPQGRKLINRLLKEQEELAAKIREAGKDEALYAELTAKKAELVQAMQQDTTRLGEVNSRLALLVQLEQAWEPWTNLQLALEKKAQVEDARDFPGNGLIKLENLLQKHRDNEADVQEKARLHQEAQSQLAGLMVDNALLCAQSDIERLYSEKGRLAIERKQQPLQQAEEQSLKEQYQRSLREIGPEWQDAMLAEVDISVAVRQKVQEFAGRFLQVTQKISEAEVSEKRAVQLREELNEEVRRFRLQLERMPVPGVTTAKEMELLEEGLRTTRSQLIKGEQLRQARNASIEAAAELDCQLAQAAAGRKLQSAFLPAWAGPVIGAGCLAGAGFLWQVTYAGAAAVACAGLIAAILVMRQRQQEVKERRAWGLQMAAEEQRLKQQKAKIAGTLADLDKEWQLCEVRLEAATQAMGLGKPDTIEEADELEKEVVTIRKAFENRQQLLKQSGELAEKQKAAAQQAEAALLKVQACYREKQLLTDEWQNWLKMRHFSTESSPEAFEIVLKAVEGARALKRQYEQAAARVAVTGAYLDNLQAEFALIQQQLQRTGNAVLAVHDLELLYQELTAAREIAKEKLHLQQTADQLLLSLEQSRTQAALSAAELAGLYRQTETAGEEEFRALAARHEEWRMSEDTSAKMAAALRAIAGTAAKQAALEAALGATNLVEISQERDRLSQEKIALERGAAQKPQAVGALDNQLKQLGQDDKLNILLAERNAVASQLVEAVKQWAKLSLSRQFLEQARSIYEQERQPGVILQADKFLRTMTGSRYQLLSAIGGSDVQLLDNARNSKREEIWSSGLADQVYLAVRLGLALEFGRLLEPVPLILDDILVRFDTLRQRGAAKVLFDVAGTQQVFLFSCHEHTRQIIREVHADGKNVGTPVAYYDVSNGLICAHK